MLFFALKSYILLFSDHFYYHFCKMADYSASIRQLSLELVDFNSALRSLVHREHASRDVIGLY